MLVDQFQKPLRKKKQIPDFAGGCSQSAQKCLFTEIYAKRLLSSKEMSKLVKAQKLKTTKLL